MELNRDVALLILRMVVGLLFVGHGAQKLFGWFGGTGLDQYVSQMRRMNVHPSALWATLSACSEFFGGLGFAVGLLTPVAAAALIGTMLVAAVRVHLPKGLWNTKGGFEFPLVMATVALCVGLAGPGSYALDTLLDLALPVSTFVVVLVLVLLSAGASLLPIPSHEGRTQQRPL
jgi:putative oxidoreductase